MGYIKKLKNNELVGGTDKTTIYPVTSTEAVFEEITNGNESSFKSQKTINKEQQDELDNHEERIQAAEAEDIKSITINGSTKEFRVDDRNNVDLTIYTVDNDPEMPSIASNVEDLRNMVGTSTPVLETSHKTRIETLEGGESVTGSVENKIKTKVDSINSSYQDDNNEYVKYSMTQTSGEVANFNIDETNLKNAIASLNTSISGDNIVIRSGSTPSGTGEAGKIYRYVNSSNNTYTDYMYSGGSWIALATHDTSDEQAQVAYYTCTATGSGAQATKQFVGNGSLTYTPSSGGHIKILMGEANTATGTIYLQYNTDSTNTKKPLYYNGEPVSIENTWEAGETIAVYYDPSANSNAGAYFASNAQGGGGKAEKIKYDNSQSGLSAENVQGALDELGQRAVIIDSDNIVNDYSDSLGYMSTSGNSVIWISNNSNRKHKAIPVSGEQFVKITAGTNNAKIAFSTSSYTTPTSSSHGQTISSLCANTGLYNVDANNTSVFQIPVDCAYILVNVTSDGSTYYTPNSLYLGNNINSIVKDNKNAIDEEVIGSLPISLNMKRYIATNKEIGADVSTIPLFNNTTQNYAYAIIPCSNGDTFKVTGKGGSTPRLWCFTDSAYYVISVADSNITLTDAELAAPTNSAYLIVNIDTRQPYNIVKLSNVDNTRIDRIVENLDELNDLSGVYTEYHYNVVIGSYNQDTGVLGATTDYNRIATAKIPCDGIDKIKTNCQFNGGTTRAWILFYDATDNYIDRMASTYDSEGYAEISVPKDAAYFAMNLTSTGEDVSYVKFYLQPSNECIEDIDNIEQTISGIDNVEVADADIYLSDFKVTGVDDDTAIEQMLSFGDVFAKRTYHIDVPVTISNVIYLKSNTTVLIEEDIKQADGMFECVFRGANVVLDENDLTYLPEKIEQIENIKILGVGNDRLIEGPDVNYIINNPSLGNQEAVGDYYGIRTHQIDLTMCKNFEIANLTFKKTRGWCLNFDFCDHGKIHDLSISSTCKNGDGVDIRTGCHDIEVYNVNGDTSDDLLAINSSAGRTASSPTLPSMYASEASGRMRPYITDRRRFDAHDINVHDCQYKRVVRNVGCVIIVVAKNGTKVYNINLDNLTEISTIQGKINIFLGAFRDTNSTYNDGDVYNVRITRGHSTTSNACVTANKVCRNVWVNKCVADNNVLGEIIDHDTNGFTFTNSVGNVVEYPGYPNLDSE